MPPTRTRSAALAALALAVLAGCGSGTAGSGSDTASVVPPSAYLYAEAVVDPEGGQEDAVRSIVGRFPGEGPAEQRLEKLIADAIRESDEGRLEYEKDVQPWLGDKIAFFASAPARGTGTQEMPAALVIATEDDDKARDAIEKSGGADLQERTYKDVDYWRDADDDGELNAGGVIDGFAVIGNEPGFKAAVDASKDRSLAEAERYSKAVEDAEEERVGLLYGDVRGVIDAVGRQQQSAIPLIALSGPLEQLFGDRPVVVTAKAEDDGVVVDSALSAGSGVLLSLFGKGTGLLEEVPAGSWAAVGQPDVGKYLSELVGTFAGLAGGRDQIAAQLRRATGLDLDRDVLGWIGDVAFFAQGVDRDGLGGGVVIESTDPAASKRALATLRRLITRAGDATARGVAGGFVVTDEETPAGLYFLEKGRRVVIAYSTDAAEAALAGGGGLGSDARFKAAKAKLGDGFETSTYVLIDPIVELARNLGADEAKLAEARPYLQVFDHIVGGTKVDGDELRSRVRLSLK